MASVERCRACRAPVQPGAHACATCGLETGPAQNERRQLTVLFCDVVGSTALSERLDPEDLRDLLSSYQRVCRDAVGYYEGHVSQFLGDGVMSYFGYPVAHEDDAVRAILSALRIVEGIKLVNEGIGRRLKAEIHVRVGIHTGIAVVGEVGPGGAHDRLAVGQTVNLAARIEAFADVGATVVSASTARLVLGQFDLESLGLHTLRGFSQPIELFRVLRSTDARTKFEATARAGLTPHVGRQQESARLLEIWEEVLNGADRVVVVRGEPGIGKSRIIHQFRHTSLNEAVRVLECFCSPLTQATALAPIIATLDELVIERSGGDTSPPAKLAALRDLLSEYSRFGDDALPLMAALLSLPGADDGPIRDWSPPRRRTRTLETLREWIGASGERIPMAILVEDVHWADPSTLDLLDLIVRGSPLAGRTLICLTGRPEFLVRWSNPHVRTIELPRLSGHDIEAMITHLAGGHALPAFVVKQIAERSEGVPLFVEEVTRAVLESGALRLETNRYELAGSHHEQFIPATVQASLLARFDRLGESRGVAQLGAAIGRDFTYPLIRAVAGLSDDEIRDHLDRLCRSELAFSKGEPPNSSYTFKHALIQDAIYGTLLKRERLRVHERVFTTLREQFPDIVGSRPEMAAHHAENAGLPDLAVPLLQDAGVRAFGRTAMAEAVKHLGRAIELVDVLEEPARSKTESELQGVIGPAYMTTLGWAAPEVERSSARLRELARSQRDGAKLFQAVWGLWTVHFLRGRLDLALDLAREVFEMALVTGDPMLRIAGHHALGYTHVYRGEYAEALQHADEGLERFDLQLEKRIALVFGFSSSCALWLFRAQAQQAMGTVKASVVSLHSAQKLAEELRHAPSKAYVLCQLCNLFRLFDDVDQVILWAPAMRSLSTAEGFALWIPLADVFLAWANARQGGDPSLAVEMIQASLNYVHESGTYLNEPDLACMLAETLLLARRPEDALRVARDALEIARLGKNGHGEPELFRIQGEALKALGDERQAGGLYRQGIEASRSMGARFFELRCALALARLGTESRSYAELRVTLDGLNEGFEHGDYRQAIDLLERPEAD